MPPFLELRNVTKIFGGGLLSRKRTVALNNVSFTIDTEHPSVRSVAGESGSGKSTLGLILMGFLAPTSGQVLYNGRDVSSLNSVERRQFRREVQAVFQDPFSVYNPFYKVDHVLEMPITKFKLADSPAEAKRLIHDVLTEVGLQPEETLGRFPHQLSGGQRQRIMVARALLTRPRLIIADEPVSMVDASLRATILESLARLNQEFGISILYITHDLTTAYHVSEDIIVLYQGTVAEAGDVGRVIKAPQHPYTQLLVNSIPWPDLERTWGDKPLVRRKWDTPTNSQGCQFAPRCPQVMEGCHTAVPLLYQTDPDRAASCFLYDESPPLTEQRLSHLFESGSSPS